MDLICPMCAEPWDVDSFHDVEGMSFTDAQRLFRTEGCGAVFGGRCSPPLDPAEKGRAAAAGVLYDLLGDDVDGAAAMLEDFALDMGGG